MAKATATTIPHDPHAHVADVEVAEKCFHGLATSSDASNDVAGTWKHFSAAFSSVTCSPITPLRRHDLSFTPEAHEVPKHTGGQKPPMNILFF